MKRTMMLVTGILAAISGGGAIISGIVVFGLSFPLARDARWWTNSYHTGILVALIVTAIIIIAIGIAMLILGIQLARKSRRPDYTGSGTLIAVLVLSVFGGGLATIVCAIIALCMSWEDADNTAGTPTKRKNVTGGNTCIREFDQSVCRLKQYRADGIITEDVYEKKLKELADKCTQDLIKRASE